MVAVIRDMTVSNKEPQRGVKTMPRKSPGINASVRGILITRIELATKKNQLTLDFDTFQNLLWVLFPEDFEEPPTGEPTETPPCSVDRILEYSRRVTNGQSVFCEADKRADGFRTAMKSEWCNGKEGRSLGWHDEGAEKPE